MVQKPRPALNSRTAFLLCIGAACVGILIPLVQGGQAWMSPLVGLAGLAWAAPELLRDSRWPTWQSLRRSLEPAWLGDAWFGVFILFAGLVGFWGGARWGLALFSLCAALAAWDLQAFRRRVYQADVTGVHVRAYHTSAQAVGQPEWAGGRDLVEADQAWPGEASQRNELFEAQVQEAERAALERAHLRALGLASLAGFGLGAFSFGLTAWIGFEAGILVGLGLGLALAATLVVVAQLLGRRNVE